MTLNTFWEGIGSSLLMCVVWVQQIRIMLVFGASVPGVKGLMQQEVFPHRQVPWRKIM